MKNSNMRNTTQDKFNKRSKRDRGGILKKKRGQ